MLTVLKFALGAVSKEFSCHSISSYCLGTINVGKVRFSMMGGVFFSFGQKNSGEYAALLSLKIPYFFGKKLRLYFVLCQYSTLVLNT